MPTQETTHLGALIEQQQTLNGLTYREIAARAEARGQRLTKSNIGRIAAGADNPQLTKTTVFGLAAGLGITPATVARAALADMGIILTEPEADSETAIRTDPTLPEQGRRLLLALLEQIRADMSPPDIYRADGSLNPDQVELSGPSKGDIAELRKKRGV